MLHYVMCEHCSKPNSVNSFTSGKPEEDSTSSTLLRKAWVEENGHHGTVASCAQGWALCVNWFCKCNVYVHRYACQTVLQDLCEVNGSVVRNGRIGQLLQDWGDRRRGHQFLEDLDLLMLIADGRYTHFSGSLGRQHIRNQMKFTIRRKFP